MTCVARVLGIEDAMKHGAKAIVIMVNQSKSLGIQQIDFSTYKCTSYNKPWYDHLFQLQMSFQRPLVFMNLQANAYNYSNLRYHNCQIHNHLEVTFLLRLYDRLPLHCKLFEINYEREYISIFDAALVLFVRNTGLSSRTFGLKFPRMNC